MFSLGTECAFAEITADLQFSGDDGLSWSDRLPVLKGGQRKFILKVNWEIKEASAVPADTAVMTFLYSLGRDFASANRGRQNLGVPDGKYHSCQQIDVPFSNAHGALRRFLYKVDVGVRPPGVKGVNNKISDGKWENAELSPLTAFTPGEYTFAVIVFYYDRSTTESVLAWKAFNVKVEE